MLETELTQEIKALLWLHKNRGKMPAIAEAAGVSQSYVSMILKGKRHNEKVERLLRQAGAPVKVRE